MPLKLLIKITLCFLSFSIFSHEGKHYQLKECRSDIDPLEPVVIKNSLPIYPRNALAKAIEANVLPEIYSKQRRQCRKPGGYMV